MNHNDNADRSNGRRDEDAIPTWPVDCTETDQLAMEYARGDRGASQRLAAHLLDVPPDSWREILSWLLTHGERLRGDA